MKSTLPVLLAGALTLPAAAQTTDLCATDEMRRRMIAEDPTFLEREARLEEDIRRLLLENAELRDDDTVVITIPVVFHILHLNGAENITNAQVMAQMETLNRDYRAEGRGLPGSIITEFRDRIGKAYIQFKLATKDPYGNCHNGIDRIRTVQTQVGDEISKANIWQRDRYLNVWSANQHLLRGAGVAGYVSGSGPLNDGVMMRRTSVGGSYVLSHEVGHYLGLPHVWGGTNDPGVSCGDDGVEDTPITMGFRSCQTASSSKVCDPDSAENFQNFMDYSGCQAMFTKGQVNRMRIVLQTSLRSGLWTTANLASTGVAGGSEAHCAPEADFHAMVGTTNNAPIIPFSPMACTGVNVLFWDNSTRALPTTWSWTFQDGSPATSNQQHPTVSFSSPGWKRVSLTVGNDHGSTTRVNDYAVYIGDQADAFGAPAEETFEAYPGIWPYHGFNYDNNHTAWKEYTGPGARGGSCAWLNSGDFNPLNILNPANLYDIDDLISPVYDLTQAQSAVLSFRYSYSTKTTVLANVTEKLEVWSSTDCGRTWQERTPSAGITGVNLITNGTMSGPGDWKTSTLTLPGSVMNSPTVRFRFRYHSSAFSGDLFIDDINVGGTVGMDEHDAANPVSLFPNPTNDRFNVQVAGMDRLSTEITVQDIRGAVVYRNVHAPVGAMGIEISSRGLGLAEGIYVLRAANEEGVGARKLVVGR